MEAPEPRRPLALAVLVLAGALIGLPWATGGRSAIGQAALVLLLSLAGAAGLLCRGSEPSLGLPPLLLVGGVLVGAAALFTLHPDRTVQALLLLLAYLAAAGVAARAVALVPWAERALLAALWVSGLAVCGAAVAWWSRGNDGGFYAGALIGPFGYPNAMGGFLLLTGGAALAAFAPDRRWLERGFAAAGCAASLLGLYLSGSRGILLSAAVGLLLWALVRRDRWWPRGLPGRLGAVAVLLGGLGVLAARLEGVLGALWSGGAASGADTSTAWRLHMLRWTGAMIRDHPWVGVGPGAFPVALTHYQRLPYVGGENPHNFYLEIAAEYGLPVGVLVVAGLAVFLGRTFAAARRLPEGDPVRNRLAALLGALAAFALHSAFDLDWSFPAIALVAATITGMASARLAGLRAARRPDRGIPFPRMLLVAALLVTVVLGLTRYYATTLVGWGRSALAAEDVSGAERSLDLSRRLNPLSYPALYWLSWTALRTGSPQRAIRLAERTVRIAPEDPSGYALIGEIALAAREWRAARSAFRHAVDRAPMAHLSYHAGLLEAAVRAGDRPEAIHAYEAAISLFAPERVLHREARCLAPGDRYLLARMSRTASRLYGSAGDSPRREAALDRARTLSQPDLRGICTSVLRPGQTSPEATVLSFWRAWSDGRLLEAERLFIPGRHEANGSASDLARLGRDLPRRARVAWVLSLAGGEWDAVLRYEVEAEEEGGPAGRCANSSLHFTGAGWLLESAPSLDAESCPGDD